MSEMEEKVTEEQVHYPYAVVIRFRGEGKPYSFGAYDDDYHKGDWVVVETQQGQEMGVVQAEAIGCHEDGTCLCPYAEQTCTAKGNPS